MRVIIMEMTSRMYSMLPTSSRLMKAESKCMIFGFEQPSGKDVIELGTGDKATQNSRHFLAPDQGEAF
ncbi:MAG TPA: hypothetical protein VG347_18250 [Verrucomicrobiae bacterium]|nr:hypothetical protein [Verrucomicrobiae bacterium]